MDIKSGAELIISAANVVAALIWAVIASRRDLPFPHWCAWMLCGGYAILAIVYIGSDTGSARMRSDHDYADAVKRLQAQRAVYDYQKTLRVICAWCGRTLALGAEHDSQVSHGMCDDCAQKEL